MVGVLYEITAGVSPAGAGTVNGSENFSQHYEEGETATLIATPETGYEFVNWTENGDEVSADATYSFTVEQAHILVANFVLQTFEISASANPTEGGSVTGAGTYSYGQTATLTATPETGYEFVNWTENGDEVSADATYSFTVTQARTLVANFVLQTFEISASANPTEGGSVTGAGTYSYSETATLTATPETGYEFCKLDRERGEVSVDATYSFTVVQAHTLVANFVLQTFEISASANPTEGGSVTGAGTYSYGETATLTATPETNYDFVNWTENGTEVSADATYSFTVAQAHTLVANFKLKTSINELINQAVFVVYPNPASELINIELADFELNSNKVEIVLYDVRGQTYIIENFNINKNKISLNVSGKVPGLYFVQMIIDGKKTESVRIQIMR
jgi:hypothetical protein